MEKKEEARVEGDAGIPVEWRATDGAGGVWRVDGGAGSGLWLGRPPGKEVIYLGGAMDLAVLKRAGFLGREVPAIGIEND